MSPELRAKLASDLGADVLATNRLSGGDINDAFEQLKTSPAHRIVLLNF